MQNAIANVGGTLVQADTSNLAAVSGISPFDRSYLYGDSLYEVARSFGGKLHRLDEHFERLEASGRLCKMEFSQSRAELLEQTRRTIDAFQALPGMRGQEMYCRWVLSRGVGKIGFGLQNLQTPTHLSILVQKLDTPSAESFEKGMRVEIASRLRNDPRALDPAMKSGNYLNSVLAYLEAAERGFEDALLCNADGHLTEGTTFNLFYARDGVLATPPLEIGVLDGITRRDVIRLAAEMGVATREVRFPPEYLWDADEVFLTSTIRGVFPIVEVAGRKIAGGKPGALTRKLARALLEDAGAAPGRSG